MFKNVASQKVAVFAWDNAAGSEKTGDAANISAQISKDGGACAVTNDAAPTELDSVDAPGIYIFDMTQAETNADLVVIYSKSSTNDIVLRPVIIYTQTVMRGTDSSATEAKQDIIDTVVDGIQTDLSNATDGLGALKALIDTIDTVVDAIKAVTDNLPNSGALSDLATILVDTNELQTDWVNGGRLDLLIDAILLDTGTTLENHLTDIKGTGFIKDTDSLPQCLTATGFSTHDAAAVKTAIEAAGSHLALIKAVTDLLPNSGALTDIDTGVNNLEARLTAVRAGYLDELAAANIPADIDTLLTRLSAANAQAIADWINGGRLDLILDELTIQGDINEAAIGALNDISVANIIGVEVDNDGTAISLAGAIKLILAVLTGKSSGGGTATIVFRDINDAKNRISATVDANGNRTAIGTRDAT